MGGRMREKVVQEREREKKRESKKERRDMI